MRLFQSAERETNQATTLVDQFMRAGANQDAQAGFRLFAQNGQQQSVTEASIAKLFDTRRDLFADYQEVEMDSFRIQTNPQGPLMFLAGPVQYTDETNK
jgi:hypothetical protein